MPGRALARAFCQNIFGEKKKKRKKKKEKEKKRGREKATA